MQKRLYLDQERSTLALGIRLSQLITHGVIFLEGQLGAGKTTLVRGFLRGLGHLGKVKSPTYTIVEPYAFSNYELFHFDFYRIEKSIDLQHLGLEDYFRPDTICLIEWPEKVLAFLPEPDLICKFEINDKGRLVDMESVSAAGKEIIKQF